MFAKMTVVASSEVLVEDSVKLQVCSIEDVLYLVRSLDCIETRLYL